MNHYEVIENELNLSGLDYTLKKQSELTWCELYETLADQPLEYMSLYKKYYDEYYKNIYIEDFSLIIKFQGRAVGIWGLSLYRDVKFRLTNSSFPVRAPVFINTISKKTIDKLTDQCFNLLRKISNVINAEINAIGQDSNGYISKWDECFIKENCRCRFEYGMKRNCTNGMDGVRKNYIQLCEKNKNLKCKILEVKDEYIWCEYKKLHEKVSGRKTRSDESWEIQGLMLGSNQGILIYIVNESEKMIGAGFFNFSKTQIKYMTAAYDHDYHHLPLGHLVQKKAIDYMIKKGIDYYEIGEYLYNQDDEKKLNIQSFKKGFAFGIERKIVYEV